MEDVRQSKKNYFDAIFNINGLLVIILSKELDVIYANKYALNFLESNSLIGKKITNIPYKEDGISLITIEEIQHVCTTKKEINKYIKINSIKLKLNMLPITSQNSSIQSVMLLGKKYSKIQAEFQKPKKNEISIHINNVIDHVPAFIFWKDKKSNFLGCNKAFAKSAGLDSPEDIIGKTDYDLPWSKEESHLYREDDRKVIESGKAKLNIEESQTFPNGKTVFLLTNKVPLYNNKKEIIGVLGIYNDITKLKYAQNKLNETLKLLKVSNKTKSAFIANMSHDLRTPITGILAMIQDMLNTAEETKLSVDAIKSPTGSAALQRIVDTVQRDGQLLMGATDELLQLCNEILEVVQLESGKATHYSQSFDVKEVVMHNVELLQPTAHHKQLRLTYAINSNVPTYLKGARLYLDRILLNLMSNALKFTQQGSVHISIKALDKKNYSHNVGDTVYIEIRVQDTGIGIPHDKFDIIFEHFSRLTPSYDGLYKGAGLGLYTVKRYIEAMQGSIDVSSELNKGTCFTVTVPFTLSDHADRVKHSVRFSKLTQPCVDKKVFGTQGAISAEDTAASILVVEDNQLAAIAVKLALKRFHCHVETAKTGSQAVKMAQQGDYDLILMDVGLPDFSGIEATKKIRKLNDAHKSQVPIVALTGHANNAEMRQHVLDAGMQEVLSKPAQPLALESVLQNYVFKVNKKKQPQPATSDACDESSTSSVVIDWDGCVRMCQGDAEFARHMLSLLDKDLTEFNVIVAHAYAKRDMKTLCDVLHRTRGGVCYLKVPELEYALKILHEAVKEAPQHREGLEKSYTALQQAIEHFKTSWVKILNK